MLLILCHLCNSATRVLLRCSQHLMYIRSNLETEDTFLVFTCFTTWLVIVWDLQETRCIEGSVPLGEKKRGLFAVQIKRYQFRRQEPIIAPKIIHPSCCNTSSKQIKLPSQLLYSTKFNSGIGESFVFLRMHGFIRTKNLT